MNLPYLTAEKIHLFIERALAEDVGEGDHSTLASVPAEVVGKAQLIIKDRGILAGVALAEQIFKHLDQSLKVNILLQDGQAVKHGDVALIVAGSARSILTAERLVLNCMQRMSGIATLTHQYVQAIAHTHTKLLDTRKTTPNFRLMEKWAVYIGGGMNHRVGLYDMIMLKDNHIDYAGGITQAIENAKNYLEYTQKKLKIEIEVRNLHEVEQVLATGGVDFIMLDNFSLPDLKEAVKLINKRIPTEASGGIDLQTVVPIAETGVDFISIGALTHSYKSLDMSLKAIR
ncbi:MAG: carboxylating nicotinate-nucleotide diphosphorylase [Microscillaceae bacterium]|nr:carboxylating nicotinate-nucleotide diphosphorylase [Microscillaceae bacterium]MDW8460357.1 carboxylating nicotinate-nucleotide diphosphorylase [Cytophagales bacterium]